MGNGKLDNVLLVEGIFKNAKSVIYTLELDREKSGLTLTRISEYANEILGYTAQELVENPELWYSLIHPEDKLDIDSINKQLLSQTEPREITYRIKHKTQNHYLWIEDTLSPIFNESGSIIGFIGIMNDITHVKKVKSNLETREQEISQLLEIGKVVLYEIDARTFMIRYVSSNIQSLLGYSMEEVYEKNWWRNNLHPDSINSATLSNRISLTQKSHNHEYQFRKKNGEYIWIFDQQVTIYHANQSPDYISGFMVDISDRKKTDNALRESENLLSTVLSNLPIGIAINTVEPYVDFKYMNDAFPKAYRTTRKQLEKPDAFWDTVYEDPAVREEIKQKILNDCSSNNPHQMHWEEIPITRKGEETTYISAMNIPIPKNMMMSMVWDVTEQKNLREQLIHSQKIDSIGHLAGGIAHDFNNMLSVIMGRVDIMLEYPLINPGLKESLQEIQKVTERSANLTHQLLAFSRQQTHSPKTLNVNHEIQNMLNMLKRLIGENINLTWIPQEGLWNAEMDPTQIGQILTNLCINARDAINGVGSIVIETGNRTIESSQKFKFLDCKPGDYVMISVSDTGSGIEKHILDKIFDPFFTTKELGLGTGLGLSTVYGIVKQNKGGIHVYSEVNTGTTFKIFIAKSIEDEKVAIDSVKSDTQTGNETILLVEDDTSLRELTKIILTKLGYNVITASTPKKAIEITLEKKDSIQMLMSDIIMPEMNGKQLYEAIHEIIPSVKCLFTSGYTANVIAHEGLLENEISFIQKPFSKNELAIKIRETLNT